MVSAALSGLRGCRAEAAGVPLASPQVLCAHGGKALCGLVEGECGCSRAVEGSGTSKLEGCTLNVHPAKSWERPLGRSSAVPGRDAEGTRRDPGLTGPLQVAGPSEVWGEAWVFPPVK